MDRECIVQDMKDCKQTEDLNVLEHGQMVNKYYMELFSHLTTETQLSLSWRLPQWLYDYKTLIIKKLLDNKVMEDYQVYHDCGKPYCRTVDDQGKQHFHNHSQVSSEIAKILFPNNEVVHRLISMDMDIHTLKPKDIEEFTRRSEAVSLLITGLCEIHANASMFGGIESTCFKIKWKQINRRGKKILSTLNDR